jgi:hypothetical protein
MPLRQAARLRLRRAARQQQLPRLAARASGAAGLVRACGSDLVSATMDEAMGERRVARVGRSAGC